ncbi:choice-of-anchor L domain-containing protein [Sphingomonas nostoxanthinifaciens]|nr:choice-of-anchor L domain-containing protein [Sphingomonas nostoxanthinifaciens]
MATSVSTNPVALANALSGTGLHVLGATLSGDAAAGTFSGGMAALGINSGVVLSTGSTLACIGSSNTSGSCGNTDTATSRTLTMTFKSDGTDLFFNYVFGSEEYNSYVGSKFNDQFTLTLTGPGYSAVNLAQLPNGDTVSINNVNLNKNSTYYRNNSYEATGSDASVPPYTTAPSLNLPIQLDGLTTVLTAKANHLTVGATYSLAFSITDVSDKLLDSAVFIQAGSVGNVPVPPSGVPEPASWAMMVGGFGLAGAAMRRRAAPRRLA